MLGLRTYIIALVLPMSSFMASAQCYDLNPTEDYEIAYSFPNQCMTVIHDVQGRAYLYTANMTGGVKVYKTSDQSEVAHVAVSEMENLSVTSVSQVGDYVFAALGDHFANDENSGMAILDMSDPENPEVRGTWKNGTKDGGAGIVKVVGSRAYLGAMQHGLIILDLSDKDNISEVSRIVPDINFPDANPDPDKYNARGLEVEGNYVYLCYDAGGVRIIDISDEVNPTEVAQYSLPTLNGLPRAYNNCVLSGDHLFVAIDYCGMEILDVSDVSDVSQVSWWNEWACETSANIWFNSPGHTNEIAYMPDCQIVGMSAGKSEAVFVDVSDVSTPVLCDSFGTTTNDHGTWGISSFENTFYLGYIFVPLGIPFYSNYGGVKAVKIEHPCALDVPISPEIDASIAMRYDAFVDRVIVESEVPLSGSVDVLVSDVSGRVVLRYSVSGSGSKLITFPVGGLSTNTYMISCSVGEEQWHQMVYIQ